MKTKHIFDAASKLIKPLLKNQEEYFIALLENWTYIVPKSWQHSTYPIKLKWLSNEKAALVVNSINNANTIQLSFESSATINQINTFLGHKVVSKILFTHY